MGRLSPSGSDRLNGFHLARFGFVLKNARPIVPEGTVDRPYGRFPVAAFPLSDVADPWLANRRTDVTRKQRFSEGGRDDPDDTDGVYVSAKQKQHAYLFNKHHHEAVRRRSK